jgi:hypothetical protein
VFRRLVEAIALEPDFRILRSRFLHSNRQGMPKSHLRNVHHGFFIAASTRNGPRNVVKDM